jgi:hypothetical protein
MFNALITCINLTQTMEVEMGQVVDVTMFLTHLILRCSFFQKNGA